MGREREKERDLRGANGNDLIYCLFRSSRNGSWGWAGPEVITTSINYYRRRGMPHLRATSVLRSLARALRGRNTSGQTAAGVAIIAASLSAYRGCHYCEGERNTPPLIQKANNCGVKQRFTLIESIQVNASGELLMVVIISWRLGRVRLVQK